MKKIIGIIALYCYILTTNAQTTDTLTLKDLEIPNSPGFTLLDKAPTSIETPTSSKAFALSIINSFSDANGFPKNYAAEFTPFWFFKHNNMTALKYMDYNEKKKSQNPFGNLKKVAISFAYVNTTDSLTQKEINNVSLGMRVNVVSIKSKKDIKELLSANEKFIEHLKNLQEQQIDSGITDILLATNPSEYHKKMKTFLASHENDSVQARNQLKEILKRRPVFAIDGALAYNTFFIGNDYSNSHFGRFGAWLTMNYSIVLNKQKNNDGQNYFNIYVLGRYLSDGFSQEAGKYVIQNATDVGGKLELEFKKICFSYEYIYRKNDSTNTYRSSGLIKYKISDQLYLTGAFGKNFGSSNNLISLLGINWGFSSGMEKASPKLKS